MSENVLAAPRSAFVPEAVTVYATLGLLDMGFSLMAFQVGIREGNPVLGWLQGIGLFELGKLFLTGGVVVLGYYLWRLAIVRVAVHAGNAMMLAVLAFHLSFWIRYLGA